MAKTILKTVFTIAIAWLISWLLGGLILTLAIHHCLFINTIATTLGVADLSFVNYANASLVISILSTLRFNVKSGK